VCGITGIKAFNELGRFFMINNSKATLALKHRGPDSQGFYLDDLVLFGHRRLSIQDTSSLGNQPMKSDNGQLIIAFNGEVYNFKELRQELTQKGYSFKSETDTEVILKMYQEYGTGCFEKLNGFFALSIYDKAKNEVIITRDRFGIKPLYYFIDEDKFIFSSEIRSIMAYNIPKEINQVGMTQYFQFNYIPEPQTIYKNIFALEQGTFLKIKGNKTQERGNYVSSTETEHTVSTYSQAKDKLKELLYKSVEYRLIADVPVGSFLSGGIDSTVITGLASQMHPGIHTFSIGYSNNPYFDESKYAEMVANKHATTHHSFMLSNLDLLNGVDDMLSALDQPFADSSALPVHILSRQTKKHVKVALSGDGADELFAGYNKYKGEYLTLNPDWKATLVKTFGPFWKYLPQSRNGKLANLIRQFERYCTGAKMPFQERYIRWCKIIDEKTALNLFSENIPALSFHELVQAETPLISELKSGDLQSILLNDQRQLLKNDMLVKIDRMSMANGLEVRVPFLDAELVNFANSLPIDYKINHKTQKLILKEAFDELIPKELYNRPKHGFEVPMLDWLRKDLKSKVDRDILDRDFIQEQAIFSSETLNTIVKKMNSNNPGDAHAQVWSLVVFQDWWKKNFQV
jgi:asparagine synthase (glutamine-hydrolysing)